MAKAGTHVTVWARGLSSRRGSSARSPRVGPLQLLVCALLLSACAEVGSDPRPPPVEEAEASSDSTVPTPTPGAISAADEGAILAAVAVAQLSAEDADGLGSPLRLSIVRGEAGWTMSSEAQEKVQEAVEPASVTWVEDLYDVIGWDALDGAEVPEYSDVGAVLVLGVPRLADDGSVEVVSQFWCGTACGGGGVFRVERGAGGWRSVSVSDVWTA